MFCFVRPMIRIYEGRFVKHGAGKVFIIGYRTLKVIFGNRIFNHNSIEVSFSLLDSL